MSRPDLTSMEQCVYDILIDARSLIPTERYYSTAATMLQCDIKSVAELHTIRASLAVKLKDPINFFTYNKVEYIGFETRRLDYERDKLAGTNPIERLIAQGAYAKH